jgi:hypothetical protein
MGVDLLRIIWGLSLFEYLFNSREIHLMITETWQFLLSSEKQAFSVIKNENVSTSIYAVSQDGIKRLR